MCPTQLQLFIQSTQFEGGHPRLASPTQYLTKCKEWSVMVLNDGQTSVLQQCEVTVNLTLDL